MDEIPPPRRRLPLRLRRMAVIVFVAGTVGAAAWPVRNHAGVATDYERCSTCESERELSRFGWFVEGEYGALLGVPDTPVLSWAREDSFEPSQAYTDTSCAWDHVHDWYLVSRRELRTLQGDWERTNCFDGWQLRLHSALATFVGSPGLRKRMRSLVRDGTWTPQDLEDALRHCPGPKEDGACGISVHDEVRADAAVVERRRLAHERLQPLLDEFAADLPSWLRREIPSCCEGTRR